MAKAGDNVGVLLRGMKKDVIQRGMFLCKPDSQKQTDQVNATIYIRTKEEGGRTKPITNNYINQVWFWSHLVKSLGINSVLFSG